jgi:hypothetical protein
MSFFVVDIESDGPIPPTYSMVCLGAVLVEPGLTRTFYGRTRPISQRWNPEALAISGFRREEHETFDDPVEVMRNFAEWVSLNSKGRPIFFSDNLAYDWQWVNYYLHTFVGENVFGYSGRRIGDLYCGMVGDVCAGWKQLRKTHHDHNPVNDAIGNAEVLLQMKELGLKIQFR